MASAGTQGATKAISTTPVPCLKLLSHRMELPHCPVLLPLEKRIHAPGVGRSCIPAHTSLLLAWGLLFAELCQKGTCCKSHKLGCRSTLIFTEETPGRAVCQRSSLEERCPALSTHSPGKGWSCSASTPGVPEEQPRP